MDEIHEEETNNFDKESKMLGQPLESYEKNLEGLTFQ
jgi:hypothetical protein